jgi:alpha,alpha-trehalose phosphorylase
VRDSSLSACAQAIVAAETGHLDLAYDYFCEAGLMDLHDLEHNVRDGVHIASLAGAWLAVVAGFGGMRDHDGTLSFAPRLPARLQRLTFRVLFRGRCLEVAASKTEATYLLHDGEPLEVKHHGEEITVSSATPVRRDIPPAADRPAPSQPPGRAPRRRGQDGDR